MSFIVSNNMLAIIYVDFILYMLFYFALCLKAENSFLKVTT